MCDLSMARRFVTQLVGFENSRVSSIELGCGGCEQGSCGLCGKPTGNDKVKNVLLRAEKEAYVWLMPALAEVSSFGDARGDGRRTLLRFDSVNYG